MKEDKILSLRHLIISISKRWSSQRSEIITVGWYMIHIMKKRVNNITFGWITWQWILTENVRSHNISEAKEQISECTSLAYTICFWLTGHNSTDIVIYTGLYKCVKFNVNSFARIAKFGALSHFMKTLINSWTSQWILSVQSQ